MSEVQQSLAQMHQWARTSPDVQREKEILTYGKKHHSDMTKEPS